MIQRVFRSGTLAILLVCLSACNKPNEQQNIESTGAPGQPDDSKEYAELIRQLYEKAKQSGEEVSDDAVDWAKSDVKKIGTWEYKIASFTTESEDDIASQLNTLGSERWECFWVEHAQDSRRFYFKRAQRSYIAMAGKATKLIPVPGGSE